MFPKATTRMLTQFNRMTKTNTNMLLTAGTDQTPGWSLDIDSIKNKADKFDYAIHN